MEAGINRRSTVGAEEKSNADNKNRERDWYGRNNNSAKPWCLRGWVRDKTDRETETGVITIARVVAGGTVFLLGCLPTLFHPGKDMLGQGRVGGQ